MPSPRRRGAPARPLGRGPRSLRRPPAEAAVAAPGSCIFCLVVRKVAPAARVAETERALAFLTIGPLRPGHTLVVPRDHAETLDDVPESDWLEVARLALVVRQMHKERLGATGTTVFLASGASGEQSVRHLHLHLVPRHEGDGLDLTSWWGPRVRPASPEELDAVARRLRGERD